MKKETKTSGRVTRPGPTRLQSGRREHPREPQLGGPGEPEEQQRVAVQADFRAPADRPEAAREVQEAPAARLGKGSTPSC